MLQLGDLLQRGQCLQKAGVLLVKVGACGELAREQILRMLVVLLEDGEDRAGVVSQAGGGLIRPGGSPPRPRRTGAAGRTAALATGWPFQRRDAAGR